MFADYKMLRHSCKDTKSTPEDKTVVLKKTSACNSIFTYNTESEGKSQQDEVTSVLS